MAMKRMLAEDLSEPESDDENSSDEEGDRKISDEEEEEEEEEEDDEIQEFVSKKGTVLFRCQLTPEKGPFNSKADAEAFMLGQYYRKALKRALKDIRQYNYAQQQSSENPTGPEKQGDAKKPKSVEREARIAARQVSHKEKKNAKRVRRIENLSDEQIQKRKRRFQLKAQRRRDRAEKAKEAE
uniref:Uncharacterized protein n=1 Tax=Octactis speculum TaxID=3111310 RepID=A0A7S2FEH4_9STRA|mmetsp:Transcript_20708/g.28153  ORF Transcript_20708/g.28153 Transcript_20708/m.28153 type:complete len:183 (+) Transcript_20708:45-593(+)